jgi:hypothetical protein
VLGASSSIGRTGLFIPTPTLSSWLRSGSGQCSAAVWSLSEGLVISEGLVMSEGLVISEGLVMSEGLVISEGPGDERGPGDQRVRRAATRFNTTKGTSKADIHDSTSMSRTDMHRSRHQVPAAPVRWHACTHRR